MKLSETLLVSDLDGTLVDANGNVPPENNAAIQRYQAQGGHFAVATGRSRQSTCQYFAEWKPDAPCILLNGSVLYDYARHIPVQVTPMPAQTIAAFLAALLHQMPDAGAEVFNPDAVGVLRFETNIRNHLTPEVFLGERGLPGFPKPWCKALISCAAGRMAALRELTDRLPHAGLRIVNSSANYLEILPEGVSKGSRLRALADACGCGNAHIFAIGDYENDRELLLAADTAAVPADGQDTMRALADIVTQPCPSGAVADLIAQMEAFCDG